MYLTKSLINFSLSFYLYSYIYSPPSFMHSQDKPVYAIERIDKRSQPRIRTHIWPILAGHSNTLTDDASHAFELYIQTILNMHWSIHLATHSNSYIGDRRYTFEHWHKESQPSLRQHMQVILAMLIQHKIQPYTIGHSQPCISDNPSHTFGYICRKSQPCIRFYIYNITQYKNQIY